MSAKSCLNVDVLQQLAEEVCAFSVFGIVNTLQKFDYVLSAWFGNSLKDGYALKIDQFKSALLALSNRTVTPKVHAVFYHINDSKTTKNLWANIVSQLQRLSFSHQLTEVQAINEPPDYGKMMQKCENSSKHL